jgi:hypothetical protein
MLYGHDMDDNQDFERAKQDRLGGGGLVSVAYWILRGVQLLFGLVMRRRNAPR